MGITVENALVAPTGSSVAPAAKPTAGDGPAWQWWCGLDAAARAQALAIGATHAALIHRLAELCVIDGGLVHHGLRRDLGPADGPALGHRANEVLAHLHDLRDDIPQRLNVPTPATH